MIIKKAEYTIGKDSLNLAHYIIKEFLKNIQEHESNTFYEAYQLDNSLNFVHLMKFEDKEAEEKHKTAEYTKEFVEKLYPACTAKPIFTDLKQI